MKEIKDEMRRGLGVAVLAALLLAPGRASAYIGLCCGKCGGNMPMNIPGGGVPETHEFRFKIQPMFMRMAGLRSGATNVDGNRLLGMPAMMGVPTGKFMAVPQAMTMRMLHLALGYSFSDDVFAGAMVMYRDNRMDMAFNATMRTTTGRAGYTMKSRGLADAMLMTKYRLYADDPLIPARQVSLLVGASLPTGSIGKRNAAHPLAARQSELLPYGMQLGSGTVDPLVGLLYQGSSSPWWWGVDATWTARLYDNARHYRLGDVHRLDVYLMRQVRYDFLWQVQLNVTHEGRIRGEADEARTGASGHATRGDPNSPYMTPLWDPANYGGTNVFVTLGAQWQPAPLHILDLSVGLPVHQRRNGVQLKDQCRVMFTWYVEIPTSKSIRALTHPAGPSELGF